MEEYTLIRSKRKTISLSLDGEGNVIVRAPLRLPLYRIEEFVEKSRPWIDDRREKQKKTMQNRHVITEQERADGMERAKTYIPQRVSYYAQRMGVTYGRICIREQKTRWGSCSSKGNLNFNWKLILMPREILDYVVVHELAHRREMNHSASFWRIVEAELPDYRERRRALKEYDSYSVNSK